MLVTSAYPLANMRLIANIKQQNFMKLKKQGNPLPKKFNLHGSSSNFNISP
jgi:hypothetical protein